MEIILKTPIPTPGVFKQDKMFRICQTALELNLSFPISSIYLEIIFNPTARDISHTDAYQSVNSHRPKATASSKEYRF